MPRQPTDFVLAREAVVENLELRPLSLGEILDRTFSVYRRHFLLFAGIAAIPHLLVLAVQLLQIFLKAAPVPAAPPVTQQLQASGALLGLGFLLGILGLIVYVVAMLLSTGATVFAVSELYLGRAITIGEALRRMRGELGALFGVLVLSGMAIMAGFVLLVIPGIYLLCRFAVSVPAALLEDLGPRSALERSYGLTKDFAKRAFLIYVLYFVLIFAAASLFQWPFLYGLTLSRNDPAMVRVWSALMQVGGFIAGILVTPVMTIATSLFYYDLRVRKEAFDLQVMMKAAGGSAALGGGVPSMLS
ncbi:MAG: hypothetical protein LAN84_07410 [Acidobacteriia bacterium]|nr:hypothetical protein [Terriglobia bacterium]